MIEILGAIASIVALVIMVSVRKKVINGLKWAFSHLMDFITNRHVVSIVIVLIVSFNVLLIREVSYINQLVDTKRAIPIDAKTWGIYNASDDRKELYPDGGRIRATGQVHIYKYPDIDIQTKNYISFSYRIIEGQPKTHDESSGAYLTFYDLPVDFSAYRLLTFSIKGEGNKGNANIDLGIRLVVNDAEASLSEKEKVIRVLPSLQEIGVSISNHWENVTIDLAEFTLLPYTKPLPRNIDPNMINKLVFFVSNEIVDRYPKGSIYIKDIVFEK